MKNIIPKSMRRSLSRRSTTTITIDLPINAAGLTDVEGEVVRLEFDSLSSPTMMDVADGAAEALGVTARMKTSQHQEFCIYRVVGDKSFRINKISLLNADHQYVLKVVDKVGHPSNGGNAGNVGRGTGSGNPSAASSVPAIGGTTTTTATTTNTAAATVPVAATTAAVAAAAATTTTTATTTNTAAATVPVAAATAAVAAAAAATTTATADDHDQFSTLASFEEKKQFLVDAMNRIAKADENLDPIDTPPRQRPMKDWFVFYCAFHILQIIDAVKENADPGTVTADGSMIPKTEKIKSSDWPRIVKILKNDLDDDAKGKLGLSEEQKISDFVKSKQRLRDWFQGRLKTVGRIGRFRYVVYNENDPDRNEIEGNGTGLHDDLLDAFCSLGVNFGA